MKEIVIKISDDIFSQAKQGRYAEFSRTVVGEAIKNGKVLPKGHGELKDANKIEEALDLVNPNNKLAEALKNIINTVPTLVEANKGDDT